MIDSYMQIPFEDADPETTLLTQQIELEWTHLAKATRERMRRPIPPTIDLTDDLVQAAAIRPRELWINDKGYRGLALRTRPTGGRSYYYLFRGVTEHDDRTGRACIGSASDFTIEQARTKAHWVARGEYHNTRPRKLPRSMRVNEVLLEYFRTHDSEWFEIVHRLFDRYVVPRHGDDWLSRISKNSWLTTIETAALDQRSRGKNLHKGLKAFLNWAVKRNLLAVNPLSRETLDLPYFPDERANNSKRLTVKQLCSIYQSAQSLGHPWSTMIGLVILTGEAMENVRHLRNKDVDWRDRTWVVKCRAVPGRWDDAPVRTVRLPDEAIDLIAPYREKDDYLFASPRAFLSKPVNFYAELFQRLRDKSFARDKWGVREIRQAARFQIEQHQGPDAVQAWAKRFLRALEEDEVVL